MCVKARAYFARMEAGDEESLKLWKEFRDMSIEKYKEIYQRLNVSFDVYSGESQVRRTCTDWRRASAQRCRCGVVTGVRGHGASVRNHVREEAVGALSRRHFDQSRIIQKKYVV